MLVRQNRVRPERTSKEAHMDRISRNIQQDVPACDMLIPVADIMPRLVSVALHLIAR